MAFLHPETVFQNSRPEWDAVSACGSVGEARPTPITYSGSHFPPRPSTGNCIPFLGQILGYSFQRAPQPETTSHSKGKFRDTASATPPIRKAHLTIHPANARDCIIQNRLIVRMMENVPPDACHGPPSCQEKSPEDFEAFTFVLFCMKDRERRSYSPSTAFLAAAAMLSRSSLVGWSFAATQLSSSILKRALSGSCSSMAS